MRVYYLFKINDSFSNLYLNRTYYLYKMLEQISKSSKNDFIISYGLFEQMANPFNKTKINAEIYKKYEKNLYYQKTLNKHILDNVEEFILQEEQPLLAFLDTIKDGNTAGAGTRRQLNKAAAGLGLQLRRHQRRARPAG